MLASWAPDELLWLTASRVSGALRCADLTLGSPEVLLPHPTLHVAHFVHWPPPPSVALCCTCPQQMMPRPAWTTTHQWVLLVMVLMLLERSRNKLAGRHNSRQQQQ